MKKRIALILAVACMVCSIFSACSTDKAKKDGNTTTDPGLNAAQDEFVISTEEVTDKNGEKVTDKNGEVVTTEVVYKKDDKKKDTYILQDKDGNDVTNNKGKPITTKVVTTKKNYTPDDKGTSTDAPEAPTRHTSTSGTSTTIATEPADETTRKEITTLPLKDDRVPKTSATGRKVVFSAEDQQKIKAMLEVPYLYRASYENSDGVPTNIAAHVAMWMAEREGLQTTEYASGTIVLDLFKYFAQTVVNFKTECNKGKDAESSITYNSVNDSFKITEFENPEPSKRHTVTLTRIENLGNNNYYKVYGSVTNAEGKTQVVAVIQRNQIEATLGFSVKALKWS